jgi:hypothetical protein
MPNVRTVVCILIAGVLAVAVASLAGPAFAVPGSVAWPAASNQDQAQQSARTTAAVTGGLAVSIDSVSPQFVTAANATITVTGTITNDTGRPLDGVQVQLETSSSYFTGRSEMSQFSGGQYWPGLLLSGNPWNAPGTLHSHTTMSWTASFPAGLQGYAPYEVYPIEAQAQSTALTPLGQARTFLPYWPGSGLGAPDKLAVSWIWPLIDTPQQGACGQDLATNDLASSLAAGGRLNGLLAAGLEYADRTNLTWAVDPALLSDATLMKGRYKVGGNGVCTDTTAMPSSAAAGQWLDDLRAGTINDPMFVTPYADPDVSALVHSGLDTDLVSSYALGDNDADQVLHRSFGSGSQVAWPAGGSADASVLTSLARDGGVQTTVLNSQEMPALATATSAYPPDDAMASVTTGIGTKMSVLLADSEISGELGSAPAGSSAGAQFGVEQDFLAQTAMIVAEAPNTARSAVIAPPQRWDPSAGEAAALLKLTTSAPWLRPTALSSLAGVASEHPGATARQALPGSQVAPGELSADYMSKVQTVRASASRYESMLYNASPQVIESLQAAVAVTESSAWRGQASSGGWLALAQLLTYFSDREKLVQIISKNKVVLAGTSGVTPISVANDLDVTIRVKVRALLPADSQLSIGKYDPSITILPGQTGLVRLPVHSATLGSTSMQLQLVAPNGSPLGTTQSLTIESTRFGRALLIVIAAALGVLVLSSLARWVRRSWREGISEADGRSGGTG